MNLERRNLGIRKARRAPHADNPNPIVGVQLSAAHGRTLNHEQSSIPLQRRQRRQAADVKCGRPLQARHHLRIRKSRRILRARMQRTNAPMSQLAPASSGGKAALIWRSTAGNALKIGAGLVSVDSDPLEKKSLALHFNVQKSYLPMTGTTSDCCFLEIAQAAAIGGL